MEDLTDILDDLTNLDFNEDEQRLLDEKYKNRTQVDINEPFYKGSKFTVNLTQLLSIVLGLGVCMYVGDKFKSIYIPAFSITFLLLIFIEIGKRFSLGKVDEIRIINKGKKTKLTSKPYLIASLFFVAVSMVSGYYGSGFLIKELTTHGTLIEIDSIMFRFDKELDKYTKEYTSQKKEAFALANQLHKQSNWKGNTSKEVRVQKANLIQLGAKKDSLLNEVKVSITEDKNKELGIAKETNNKLIEDHKEWCYSFGWFFCLFAIFLDIVLRTLSRFNHNHEDRKRKENRAKKKLIEEHKEKSIVPVNQESKDKDYNFIDGDIKKGLGNKADTIDVLLKDGSEKVYTLGKFRSYYNNSSSDRQSSLDIYMDKIITHESLKK